MTPLYFNARDWVAIGLNQQQIKFLEGLLQRVGGGTAPSTDLSGISSQISAINSSVSALTEQIADLDTTFDSTNLENLIDETNGLVIMLLSEMSRLRHRVNQLEDDHDS